MVERITHDRKYIDMAEVRADYLDQAELAKVTNLPRLTDVPLIFTIRRTRDGGKWGKPENERKPLLLRAAAAGFGYLDLEADVAFADVEARCRQAGTRIIRSIHDVAGVPAELGSILRNLPRRGDEIAKAAVLPRSTADLISILRASGEPGLKTKIVLGMGPWGFPTRVLAAKLGSFLTFCSPAGMETAPGHVDPETLIETYRFRSISASTEVYCIIANPVMHSRSPWIHNPAFESAGLDAVYVPVQLDEPRAFCELARLLDIKGASVSIPHKAAVRKIIVKEDETVSAAGSCNTLFAADGGFHGTNTDVPAFTSTLLALAGGKQRLAGMPATVVGAGGTARAVTYALTTLGARVCVLNRTVQKAEALAGEFGCSWAPLEESSMPVLRRHSDLIVQTTSAGMHPQEGSDPLWFYKFRGDEVVYDVIYVPKETVFLRRAREAGCRTRNGEHMLLEQAYLQFKLFTGLDYPAGCRGITVF